MFIRQRRTVNYLGFLSPTLKLLMTFLVGQGLKQASVRQFNVF